jgi:hypothetical protein
VALAAVALVDPGSGNDLAGMVDLLSVFAHRAYLRRDQGRRTPVGGNRVDSSESYVHSDAWTRCPDASTPRRTAYPPHSCWAAPQRRSARVPAAGSSPAGTGAAPSSCAPTARRSAGLLAEG